MSPQKDNIKNKVEDKRNDKNLKTKESMATKQNQKTFGQNSVSANTLCKRQKKRNIKNIKQFYIFISFDQFLRIR